MHTPRLTQLALGLASLALLACGDDDKHGESGAIAIRLHECDLVSDGDVHPAVGDFQLARCRAQCVADATCEELDAYYCDKDASARLSDCQAACLAPKCDGGEKRYTLLQRCDGVKDCEDGADEAECPKPEPDAPKYCDDSGERITVFTRCDGKKDCNDGTDERDCPSPPKMFTCDAKLGNIVQQVPESKLCDLERDCLDGSDESPDHGCAELCPNK
jgi:hypothetical protein